MGNKKITELPDIGTPDVDDVIEIVDVSDTTDSSEGTSKKVKISELGGGGTQNIQQVLTEGNIAEDVDVAFTNTYDADQVAIDSSRVIVTDLATDYAILIRKNEIIAKNLGEGLTTILFESTATDEEFTIPNETGTAATREWTQPKLDLKADLVGGLIPSSQLPATVDEILEGYYVNSFQFDDTDFIPYVPSSNKYYLDLNSNKTFRWSGSTYIPINEGIALGETSSTAYRGDRGKTAYEHSQDVTSNPHNVTKSQVGLGNVDNTSDLNKPISTDTQTALNLKQDNAKLISANYTSLNNDNLIVNATCTITDVTSPSNGTNFTCTILSGTVTIGGVDYTQVGSKITRIYNSGAWKSYVYLDDKEWIDYSSTSIITGFSTFTNKVIKYKPKYKEALFYVNILGVSNSGLLNFTIPFNAITTSVFPCAVANNSVDQSAMGMLYTTAGSDVIQVKINGAFGNFTTSNNKGFALTFTIETN